MRPQNQIARDRLSAELRRHAPVSALELARRLDISVPTALRILKEREVDVLRIGTTKYARYAVRRALRGLTRPIPVYQIDADGRAHDGGALELIAPQGSLLDLHRLGWPSDQEHGSGYWEGLPYPLYDMRPQGFLGRNFAHQCYQELAVSPNLNEWSDDDIVYALTQRGSDATGNLIIGEVAFQRWQVSVVDPAPVLEEIGLAERYCDMADRVASLGIVGSSAAGEFPKFTTCREQSGTTSTPHVIVKFSGLDGSSTVRRWSDLLVCEHIALEVLAQTTSLSAAHSRILQSGGRTFLEVERFDRHGRFGRSALVTLASVDGAFVGSAESNWPESIRRLETLKLVQASLESPVQLLWWYGKLIANTDMHMGNLSFSMVTELGAQAKLHLAPAYDMLPMFYAPLAGGEVPTRVFTPTLPPPKERDVWVKACHLALVFWQRARADSRISASFRLICEENYRRLDEVAQRI